MGTRRNAGRAYLAAQDRQIEGKATHPDYAGRPVRISPAAVAKETRRSRNPPYTIARCSPRSKPRSQDRCRRPDLAATVSRLEASNAELRGIMGDCRSISAIW
jgi:hypothetical protein